MSNRDGFSGGFIFGSILGGVVGGAIGVLLANRQNLQAEDELVNLPAEIDRPRSNRKRRLKSVDRIEQTRRSLDDKIADLNTAIDAVRSSIGNISEPVINDDLTESHPVNIGSNPSLDDRS
jgi:gas vesicle protein